MGAQQSQAVNGTVSDIAKNYSSLIDAMMTNQVGFASSMKDISDAEREWFQSFERYVSENKADVSSEDSLYRNIQAFTRLSGDDTDALLRQIADPGMRASAEAVLSRTTKSIVLQKYYEYKYLHLSAVFMNFTEFVQKLFELTASAAVQVAENQAVLTTRDVAQLLDAMASVIPAQDAAKLKKTVQAVHKSAHDRLTTMSKQLNKIVEVSRDQIGEFPMKQLEQQQEEGRTQIKRDAEGLAPAPSPSPSPGQPPPKPPGPPQGPPPGPQGPPAFGRPPRFGDKPPMGDRSDRPDRPPRFGDKPLMSDRPPMGDRPDRPPMGDRPDRPSMGDKPSMGDRLPRFGESKPPGDGDEKPGPGPGPGSDDRDPPNRDRDPPKRDAAFGAFGFDDPPGGAPGSPPGGAPGPGPDKQKDASVPPDDAFLFGGGVFLSRAAAEIDAIVRGGGKTKRTGAITQRPRGRPRGSGGPRTRS